MIKKLLIILLSVLFLSGNDVITTGSKTSTTSFAKSSNFSESLKKFITEKSDYPLDKFSRKVPKKGKFKCPKVEIITYRGDIIKYHKPVRVHPAFKERLVKFEELVKEIALETYGRSPDRIIHLGTFNCRRIGTNRGKLSEHSFGNGIDVAGFVFKRVKNKKIRSKIDKRFRGYFVVDMLKHWNSKKLGGTHSKFLKEIGRKMIERKMFTVMLGPSWPGHKNHFHLDLAPYNVVSIF